MTDATHTNTKLDAIVRDILGDLFPMDASAQQGTSAPAPIKIHHDTLTAMILADMVEFERDGDVVFPTYNGTALVSDETAPNIGDFDLLLDYLDAEGAPACNCPPEACAGGDAATFEPYEVEIQDAAWLPVLKPSKREILADLARGFASLSNTGLLLAEQVELLAEGA